MKYRFTLAVASILYLAPLASGADQNVEYVVKFVCGRRVLASSTSRWETVAPGDYRTAINILSRAATKQDISLQLATTSTTLEPGRAIVGPTVAVPPNHALDFDCGSIFELVQSRAFLKGFVIIRPNGPLHVTAVYTADNLQGVSSIEINDIPASRPAASCAEADLTIATVARPQVTLTEAIFTVAVANVGMRDVSNVSVRAEDGQLHIPERIAEQILPVVRAGETITVSLSLPYAITDAGRLAAVSLSVSTKPPAPDCRDDNNRTVAGN